MLTLLREAADRGVGVLLVSHAPEVAATYADRVLFLSEGRVVVDAGPDEASVQLAALGHWAYVGSMEGIPQRLADGGKDEPAVDADLLCARRDVVAPDAPRRQGRLADLRFVVGVFVVRSPWVVLGVLLALSALWVWLSPGAFAGCGWRSGPRSCWRSCRWSFIARGSGGSPWGRCV